MAPRFRGPFPFAKEGATGNERIARYVSFSNPSCGMNCDIFLVGLGRRRSFRPPNVPARGLQRRQQLRRLHKSVSRSLPDLRPLPAIPRIDP